MNLKNGQIDYSLISGQENGLPLCLILPWMSCLMHLKKFRRFLTIKKMIIKKSFDAVQMMRDIRDKHYAEYESNPELREKRLEAIRKKYANKIKALSGEK
jgi:hypothetical protein